MDLHFIQADAIIQGRRVTYFVERDCDRLGWSNTVDDILTGQVENVRQVLCGDLETASLVDCSEDVAHEILARIRDEGRGPPSGSLMDFLEGALGCEAVARFEREMEAA